MQLLRQLYMSSTTAKSHPGDRPQKFVNFSHFSWKMATTIALIAAVISPAQAQDQGFSNVRINGVQLEVPLDDNNNTFMPIPDILGSGPNGRRFEFTADFYNANGVDPVDPLGNLFQALFSFQDFGNSTLPEPMNFASMFQSNATLLNPRVVSFFYDAPQDGRFSGALNVDLFDVEIDYDIPILSNLRGAGDGVFDVAERSFGFNLVAATPTPIPEATPTLGLIMLGAGGVASQLQKFKLARK